MIKLAILGGFIYAFYLNYSGACGVEHTLGCVNSNETLIIAFALYLFLGVLFFIKRRLKLFKHSMDYKTKKLKFGFVSLMFLVMGLGIMILFGMRFIAP